MATKPIYRESWRRPDGWQVRVDFLPAGGDAQDYSSRTVVPVTGVFKEAKTHTSKFDKFPIAMPEAQSCKFVIAYERAPSAMRSALDAQAVTLTGAETGYLGQDYYTAQAGFQQPNMFVVWSDRGTDTGQPLTATVTTPGSGYITESSVRATRIAPGYGRGLRCDVVAKVGMVTATAIVDPGSGYSGEHAGSTTGGSGTLLVLEWSASGSVSSIDSIVNGGKDYVVGDIVTLVGGDNNATVRVEAVDNTGQIQSLVLHGGSRFKVGDTFRIEAGNFDAVATVATIATATYTPEFIGCQRVVPSEKYTETSTGLDVEIDAIALHKMALEWQISGAKLCALFLRIYGASGMHRAQTTWQWSFSQTEGTPAKVVCISNIDQSGHYGWYIKLQDFYAICSLVTFELQSLLTGNHSFSSPPAFVFEPTAVKFYKQNTAADKTIYSKGSALSWDQLYMCAGITWNPEPTPLGTESGGIFGLLTGDKDGITAKARTGWDLMGQSCEQFIAKMTPANVLTSGVISSTWRIVEVYGSYYTAGSYNYTDGRGSGVEFERNVDRLTGKAKVHFLAEEDDTADWESYTGSKSEDGFEIEAIWNIDPQVQTEYTFLGHTLENTWRNADTDLGDSGYSNEYMQVVRMRGANLRGLFYLDTGVTDGVGAAKRDTLKQVSPICSLRVTPEGSYVDDTPPAALEEKVKSGDPGGSRWLGVMRHVMAGQDAEINIKRVAATYVKLFGTDNNQTAYELELPIAVELLPERLGSRVDVTPHPALSSLISSKGYLMSSEVDWSARPAAGTVKVRILTRSIEND